MRAFELCQSICWAITPEYLRTILAIANRESTDAMLAAAIERRDMRREAVAAMDGRPLDDSKAVTVRDGVAVLSITGPIVRYADLFSEMSGATSVQTLATDFHTALHAPDVRAILLSVDSPGGEIAGIQEFADTVYRARGSKPIVAYVSDLGASAAYWIASASDEVVIAPTALVGSIGVIAAVRDPSKINARDIEFVSSQSPRKRADPTTESGRTQIQTIVDDLGGIFVDAVATHRGVSAETVLSDYGQGGVLVGAAAVTAGLADRLGSFEGVIAELSDKTERPLVWVPGGGKHVPASKVPAARQGEVYMATMMERFWKQFGSMDEDETNVPQAPQVTHLTGTVDTTALPPPRSAQDEELARVRAELAKERSARAHDNAVAFADSEVTAMRAMPAEREALIEAYMQAATDDLTFGASTAVAGSSRVEALKARQAARPAHTLTSEAVPVNDAARAALLNVTKTPDPDDPDIAEVTANARTWAAKQNGHKEVV